MLWLEYVVSPDIKSIPELTRAILGTYRELDRMRVFYLRQIVGINNIQVFPHKDGYIEVLVYCETALTQQGKEYYGR